MRVAIDARGVQPRLQGIGRHVLNLLLGLSYRESDLEFLVIYNSPLARKVVERSGGPYRGRFQWIRAHSRPCSAASHIEIPWLTRINRAELMHDVGTCGLWTGRVPRVVTVHELSSLKYESHSQKQRLKHIFRKASLLIAVSESVAREVDSNFNISRPKIRVITNAIDPWYGESVAENEIRAMRERFKLPGSYFLCVTADRPSKNLELVKTVASRWAGSDMKWVFTVPAPNGTGENDNSSIRYLDVVEDVWLRPLYAASTALIVPSLYEGFSLPPIEALASRAVPVVSDIPPHHETLDDVLPEELFFDPRDPASLEKSLHRIIDGGDSMKASVLEKFRLVRDRYSFIETAGRVQAVYREILRG